RENAAAIPWAPPSLHRSCCQAPTTSPDRNRLVATDGSTSAPGYNVEVGVPPTVHPANGLRCEIAPLEAWAGAPVRRTSMTAAAPAGARLRRLRTTAPSVWGRVPAGGGEAHRSGLMLRAGHEAGIGRPPSPDPTFL